MSEVTTAAMQRHAQTREVKLDRTDRADCCSAAAMVRVSNESGGILDFCGHHYHRYEIALAEQGFMIVLADLRDTLVVNKLIGSENS